MGRRINPQIFRINLNYKYKNYWNFLYNKKYFIFFILLKIFYNNINNYKIYFNLLIYKINNINNNIKIILFIIKNNTYKFLKNLYINIYYVLNNYYKFKNIYLKFYIIFYPILSIDYIIYYLKFLFIKNISLKRILKNILLLIYKNKYIKGFKITIKGLLKIKEKSNKISYIGGIYKLNTFNLKLQYKKDFFKTKYGIIGIKLWLFFI